MDLGPLFVRRFSKTEDKAAKSAVFIVDDSSSDESVCSVCPEGEDCQCDDSKEMLDEIEEPSSEKDEDDIHEEMTDQQFADAVAEMNFED